MDVTPAVELADIVTVLPTTVITRVLAGTPVPVIGEPTAGTGPLVTVSVGWPLVLVTVVAAATGGVVVLAAIAAPLA